MEPEPNHVVILVIEDDPSVRTLLRDIFVEEDYDVLLAESGEKALVTLTTVRPDLITLDLDLPGINGAAVLRPCANRKRPRVCRWQWCRLRNVSHQR
jgi:CheY-like chemotaxis protein